MLKIKSGVISKPEKLLIYGAEGIGKTTLSSNVPDPLFIDTEGGTLMFDVKRVDPSPKDWNSLLAVIDEIAVTPGICKSLVIDTADWAEQMCITEVCLKNHKDGIESFNYGRGYTYVMEEFSNLIKALDRVVAAGINVIITAHAKMRKMELPDEQGAFDRWELKLSRQVSPLLKEWVDDLLFVNYKTMVVKTDTSTKAQGGKRVIYTSHSPVWDAKNRHGLPDELPLCYDSIASLFTATTARADPEKSPLETLKAMMAESNISDAELRKVVASKGHFPEDTPVAGYPVDFITQWIIPFWKQIVNVVVSDPNHVPF